MKRMILGLAFAIALAAPARPSSDDAQTEADLRRMTQELLDAVAPGKREVWERYLDARFVHMDENGVVRNKTELLREFAPLPPGLVGRIEIDTYEATIYGDIAIAAYQMQEYLDYHGQPLRSRFRALDTWRRTPEGWRLIGEHAAAVHKDPPTITLSGGERCAYEGVYALTPEISTTIRCTDDGLTSERNGRPIAKYAAELRDVFFVPGQPRTRRIFTRDASGRIDGFVDRREGEDIRWNRSGDAPKQRWTLGADPS
ncbi:nuclear transport factor 2 family protein [Luteimonas sp. R10]|uniref:nuclear transport factor 2 family protein n=1 Tax=Luteimonas sp. R10 TaxID=3108176 RepID=UPI0030864B1E|nr:nuclear transport factor 2 family protein [Luteimonas sp. R10]